VFQESQEMESGIWCHVSSTGCVGLHSAKAAESEVTGVTGAATGEAATQSEAKAAAEGGSGVGPEEWNYFLEMKNKFGLPLPEVWPLMMDHQQEVSSKGLIKLLSQIRSEVNRVNIDFLEIKNKESRNKLQSMRGIPL
jgi:hypothetical protein